MKNLLRFSFLVLFLFITFVPVSSFASTTNPTEPCDSVASNAPCRQTGGGSIYTPPTSSSSTGNGLSFNNPTNVVCPTGAISGLICNVQQIINSIIPLLLALGVVYFTWGVVQYMIAGGDEDKSKGRDKIIYGVIGLAVIMGVWGLVNLVVNTLGLGGTAAPSVNNLVVQAPSSNSCKAITLNTTSFSGVLDYFTCIISQSVIPFIFAVAIVSFIWGIVNYFIINGEEEAKREQGKQFLLWSIVALAVMVSVWGLVKLLSNTFGTNGSVLPTVQPNK